MPIRRIQKKVLNSGATLDKILDIILNVNEYQKFVPHCTHSKILKKQEGLIEAEITISFSIFKVSYISEIIYKVNGNIAEIEVREKKTHTFKNLFNKWIIKLTKDEICVDFFVEFEIKNILLSKIASASLPLVSEIILNAFIKRVNHIK
jgi:coenzyme Q-binding protein COQ10